ncbi:unnamed protein product [Rotaria socialis]|nr:unnamed protein product [Rotaria socialis]
MAPNRTVLHDKNLINNGHADCIMPLNKSWTLKTGIISTAILTDRSTDCRFVFQSRRTGAIMFQRIDLSNKWNSAAWSYSQAVLSAEMSTGVQIELRGIDVNGSVIAHDVLNINQTKTNMILRSEMYELEVFIDFAASTNQNPAEIWCDNIHLFIVYDAYGAFQQTIPNIPTSTHWSQYGVTVAGGTKRGSTVNHLSDPHGLFVDDDQTIIISDMWNHRIVQWKNGEINGQVIAGGNGKGNRLDQFNQPTDVVIDKETDSLIICDCKNDRIVRWFRRSGTTQGEILINSTACWGLAMDDQRNLYVSDTNKDEVRRYPIGGKNGTLVAGGNGRGARPNQLNSPNYIFVDRQQAVYASDSLNHRIMKWHKDAKEGIAVAGNPVQGNALTQLSYPEGLFVDTLGNLYIADSANNRVLRWPQAAKQGTVIVGGNGEGSTANQFHYQR